jgi:hypothetical protein
VRLLPSRMLRRTVWYNFKTFWITFRLHNQDRKVSHGINAQENIELENTRVWDGGRHGVHLESCLDCFSSLAVRQNYTPQRARKYSPLWELFNPTHLAIILLSGDPLCTVVERSTMLQAGRSRVRIPMRSFNFFQLDHSGSNMALA